MRIRGFHIDSFGILRDVSVDELPGGLAVFLGHNEAGKSTLLDFFRATLTGYPQRPRDRERAYIADGQSGGSLALDTEMGTMRLTRRPGVAGGEPTLTDATGAPLDIALWDRLLGSVTREVYTTIYGFSLSELQAFSSLTSEGVRNALYGASFGMGLRSPGRALKKFDAEMEKLFKAGGSRQPLSSGLREWEEVRKEMRQAEEEIARYDTLAASLNDDRATLAKVRQEHTHLEQERRALERRLGVWQQWEEWRLAGVRLERLPLVLASFPQDGPVRLERALNHQETALRETAAATERATRTRTQLDNVQVNKALVDCAPELRSLGERKTSCRNALTDLPRLQVALERLDEERERQRAALGADWTFERVHAVDRSLATRETLTRRAEDMQSAAATRAAAVTALEKADLGRVESARAVEDTAALFDALPVPEADLNDDDRDTLRAHLVRTEEAQQRIPDREKALSLARNEFTRAVSHLHLRPRQSTAEALNALSKGQDEAMRLADEVLTRTTAGTECRRQADRAKDAEEQARTRLERLQNQKEDLGDPNRAALEARRTALRSLRNAVAMLPLENSRKLEAEERYAAHMADSPDSGRSPLLITLGALLALAGGGCIAALKLWKITIVPLTPEFSWPLVLWHGYLVLLAGVAFIAAGLPRNKPEAARHAIVAEQLRARHEAATGSVVELESEIARLSAMVDLEAPSTAELDALESDLDKEREQCATNERLQQEMAVHADDLAALHQRAQWEETDYARKNTEAQNARRRWHEYLMEFGVQSVPTPDGAAAYFARVDSARMSWAAVATLEKEVAEMEGRGSLLAAAARQLLPDHAWPDSWTILPQVLDAVRRVLESCRIADLAAEERARAAEALRGAEAMLTREIAAFEAASATMDEADASYNASVEAWRTALLMLDLPASLSPATANEALQCVDRIVTLDVERTRLHDSLEHQQRERDAMLVPLQALLKRLDRTPLPCELQPDAQEIEQNQGQEQAAAVWLSLYDELVAEVDAHCQAHAEHNRLLALLAEQEGEQGTAAAVLADAEREVDKLLRLAGADDTEDFLRKFAVKTERESLSRRREDLEDALRLVAQDDALRLVAQDDALRLVAQDDALRLVAQDDARRLVAQDDARRLVAQDEARRLVAQDDARRLVAQDDARRLVAQDEANPSPPPPSAGDLETFLAGFAAMHKDELEARTTDMGVQLALLAAEDLRLADVVRTLELRLEGLAQSRTLASLRSNEASLRESLEELGQDWARYALARHLLVTAKHRFEKERQPDVIRIASSLFASITNGAWTTINASLEDSSLKVLPPHGEPVAPEFLSRGTQEQLYLALRLAHIRNHAAQATALPVIMDDILVNFDPDRAQRTAQAFNGMTKPGEGAPGHQILFFTCHPHIATMLQQSVHDSALFTVERGRISRKQ